MCGDRTTYFLNLFEKEKTNDKETYGIYEKKGVAFSKRNYPMLFELASSV